MGQIHDLVAQHGRDTARKLVPLEEKRLVDLAAEVLTDEKVAAGLYILGFLHGLAAASLVTRRFGLGA
jgi:hypothetical protein